jgi:16S rRNA (adenine1518-N6/adenine1519-N6)-dimethyltransferase
VEIEKIKSELSRLGIRPNKLLGQNFLVDDAVLDDIIVAADIKPGETVVEIGPGLGVLTSRLLSAGANVIAIEQQREFGEYLRKQFKGQELDVIIANAVLKIPELRLPKGYKVVSNLPYGITSPVINLFLSQGCRCHPDRSGGIPCRPSEMVLMVQKEVAERLTAQKNSSDRGVLTVLIELICLSNIIVKAVSRQSFWPEPKVESAVIKLKIADSPTDPKKIEGVMQIVKVGFSKKRAKLKNALKPKFGDTTSLLRACDIDSFARAEDLSASEWTALYNRLSSN